jgi:hypothetical protein
MISLTGIFSFMLLNSFIRIDSSFYRKQDVLLLGHYLMLVDLIICENMNH